MYKCVTLILSAGSSKRMRGTDKLLENIDGVSQLYRIAKAAEENGNTYITLPIRGHPREAVLASMSITKIYLNDKNTGMGSSIAEGEEYTKRRRKRYWNYNNTCGHASDRLQRYTSLFYCPPKISAVNHPSCR